MENQPEDQVVSEASTISQQFSIGAALREAREQLGLGIVDVANRIKFAPRQIESLEADDFAHLPEAAFVRGFVRSYARLLEIDASPLLAALPKTHMQSVDVPDRKSVEVPFPSAMTSRRSNIVWIAGGVGVALVLIIFAYFHDNSPRSAPPEVQTKVETLELPSAVIMAASAPVADAHPEVSATLTSVASKPATMAPVAEVKVPAVQAIAAKEPALASKPASTVQVAKKQIIEPASVELVTKKQAVKEPKKPAVKPAVPNNAVSELASMRLAFDEDSWVDVKDANGKILLSKMNHAGSLVRISGTAPLSIVIGHASGVHLFYKGKEVNLAPHTSVEVARLLLE